MTVLNPKREFHRHDEIRRELAGVVESDNFQFALSFALSEYASAARPTSEQMAAVHAFIHTLLNLPTEEKPMPTFPTRTLDHSVLEPRRPDKSQLK